MSDGNVIKVLIVDDHEVVRDGLEVFLGVQDDIALVGKVGRGEDALDLCAQARPDVVVMDLVMPGAMDGVSAIRAIRQKYPHTQIVVLTSFGDRARVNAALGAGAKGFLLKDATGNEVADAVRKAHADGVALSPDVTRLLVESLTEAGRPQSYDLTWREQEVLALLVKGFSNPAIASKLDIKTSTVKTHIGHIFSKLGVSSRVEAATVAVEHNLLD
mgnify:CR=1 FL=1